MPWSSTIPTGILVDDEITPRDVEDWPIPRGDALGRVADERAAETILGHYVQHYCWRLLIDMTPEQVVNCFDFRYIIAAPTP